MRARAPDDPRGLLLAYGAVSLASVGAGCWVAAASGVPAAIWIRNLAAWTLGLAIAALTAATAGRRAGAAMLLAALAGLAATWLSPGLEEVHRWLQLGPVRVNVAELLAPSAVVALAGLGDARRSPWLAAAGIGVLLVAQPDASQATAFGVAVIAALLLSPWRRGLSWIGAAVTALAMAASWFRPDPLAPVPEVEGIFGLAWALAPWIAVLAAAALGMASLAPAFVARRGGAVTQRAGLALTGYFAVSALAPALGAFPVPLVGMGVSPLLGSWLGVGLLAALATGRWTSSSAP